MAGKRLSTIFTSGPPEPRPMNDIVASPAGLSPHTARRPKSPSSTRSRSLVGLRKSAPSLYHSRSASGQYLNPADVSAPSLQELQQSLATGNEMPWPLLPPPPVIAAGVGSCSFSPTGSGSRPHTPSGSRPTTPNSRVPESPITPTSPGGVGEEKKKKRGWFGKSKKDGAEGRGPRAWIAGHTDRLAYDDVGLLSALHEPELWDDNGDCFVYLFPRTSGKGASFRLDSSIFSSSPVLTNLAFGDVYSSQAMVTGDRKQVPLNSATQQLSLNQYSTPPATPPMRRPFHASSSSDGSRDSRTMSSFEERTEYHVYLPIQLSTDNAIPTPGVEPKYNMEDTQTLVDIRNLFAFLYGQSIVATERRHSFFQLFMQIGRLLNTYRFSNLDGSTYGEIPTSSFENYAEELGLADVRHSREKTIEGILLGERMRSVLLYNEAFTHAVGRYDDIEKRTIKFESIMPHTRNRLERASMDLDKRTASVRLTLEDFDFPSIFTGIMSSKTADERKAGVRFDEWKSSFMTMRKYVIGLYRHRYGSWPPKASSKKNDLETSGLNRLVLRDLYHDMSSMYDLVVDRQELTTRTVDGIDLGSDRDEPTVRALRAVLSEYDRSSPPVKPPVPFDLPQLPNLRSTRPEFGEDKKKDLKAIQKKLKDEEIAQILRASYNEDVVITPFVDAFRDMERKAARGCTIAELVDQRIGQWIFMYAVLQALPMLAVDAPRISYTKGVEYFLCEPPRSSVPWAREDSMSVKRNWYGIAGGGGVVSLPSDVVEHGVEGIYRRSHCWEMAEKWTAANPILNEALHEQEAANSGPAVGLPAPPSMIGGSGLLRPDSRSSSASRFSGRESVMMLGLEALPLPAGVTPDGSAPTEKKPMSVHAVDTSKTFDAILADTAQGKGGRRKK